jgi:hypothetical protein
MQIAVWRSKAGRQGRREPSGLFEVCRGRRAPTYPFPRFPPLEVFRRRPPVLAAPSVSGRHPKTFTLSNFRLPFVESHLSALSRLHSL